jgi:Tol biopolymer transport system component
MNLSTNCFKTWMIVALLALPSAAIVQTKSEVSLRAAIETETVKGDLKGAIEQYKKILAARDVTRPVAAQALLHLGLCSEKLRTAEASTYYEQLVREYSDQTDVMAEARARLAALESTNARPTAGRREERVWIVPAGYGMYSSITPDGRYMPFIKLGDDNSNLWLHDLTTGMDRVVVHSDWQRHRPIGGLWEELPKFSPDGKLVAYGWQPDPLEPKLGSELRVAGIDGSGMRVLLDGTKKGQEKTIDPWAWSRDGKQICATVEDLARRNFSCVLVSLADGSTRALDLPATGDHFDSISLSPDGKFAVYSYHGKMFVSSMDGSRHMPLFEGPTKDRDPIWTADGSRIIFVSDRSGKSGLWCVQMADGKPVGEPELLKVLDTAYPRGFTVNDSLYYHTRAGGSDVYEVDLDPATGKVITKPERLNRTFIGSVVGPPRWSPDGQSLAYSRKLGDSPREFVIQSVRTREERQLSVAPEFSHRNYRDLICWFPDGTSLVADDMIQSEKSGRVVFRKIDVQTGRQQLFFDPNLYPEYLFPAMDISSDGKSVFYSVRVGAAEQVTQRLMRRNMETGEEKELYRVNARGLEAFGPKLSPDGRQLAIKARPFNSVNPWDSGMALMILPAEGGTPREICRTRGLDETIADFVWTKDARHLLVVRPQRDRRELWSYSVDTGEGGPAGLEMDRVGQMSIHPDGRRLAFIGASSQMELWVIRNLLPPLSRK